MSDDEHKPNPKLTMPWNIADKQAKAQELGEQAHAFFQDILDKDFTFSEFQRHWNAIENSDLSPEQLTLILSRSTAVLDKLKADGKDRLSKDCRSEIMFRFECWEKPATAQVKHFGQHDLASCLRNYRLLDLNPSDRFIQKWYNHAKPSSVLKGGKHEQRIVASIVSFGVARLKPSEVFYEEWIPKAIDEMDYMRPGQLAAMFWAFARFGQEPDTTLLDEWEQRFEHLVNKKPEHFKQRDIANIIGGCGVLHAITGNARYQKIAQAAKPLIDFKECELPSKRQLWLAHLWFDWEFTQKAPESDEDTSPTENGLKAIFAKNGYVTFDPDHRVPSLNHRPDENLMYEDKPVYVEIDGKSHFLYEINEHDGSVQQAGFTGRTLFMSALIRKFAAQAVLLRMPAKLCFDIINADPLTQEHMVDALFKEAEITQPGAYHVRYRRAEIGNDHTDEKPLIIRPMKIAAPDSYDPA